MSRASAAALAALLFFGILTVWIPYRWAVYALEAGLFALAIPWAAAQQAVWPCQIVQGASQAISDGMQSMPPVHLV